MAIVEGLKNGMMKAIVSDGSSAKGCKVGHFRSLLEDLMLDGGFGTNNALLVPIGGGWGLFLNHVDFVAIHNLLT